MAGAVAEDGLDSLAPRIQASQTTVAQPWQPILARLVLALVSRRYLRRRRHEPGIAVLGKWLHENYGANVGDRIELSADFTDFFRKSADGTWQLAWEPPKSRFRTVLENTVSTMFGAAWASVFWLACSSCSGGRSAW